MSELSREYIPDLVRGNTEVLLLSLIESMQSAHGYQLIKEISRRSCGLLQFKEGTIYPTLRKLENEGLVNGEWQVLPGGHKRRLYSITPDGQEVMKRRVATWQGVSGAINLILNPNGA